MACGGIEQAIKQAHKTAPGKKVEIEVETLEQLEQAINFKADIAMLDNFSYKDMRTAIKITNNLLNLEASGNIRKETLLETALTGVDYISIGAITKHCEAVDLSMRLI
jgi:nicotinate-nucleotide pyrophosphorylase (carboxylating)